MICVLLALASITLFITEIYFKYKNDQKLIDAKTQRYVVLGEGIPNANFFSRIDQSQSIDFVKSDIEDSTNYYADKNGFILPAFEQKKTDFAILFLGDGTTANLHLDSKYRFPYLVGETLAKRTNYKISSYNAGYPGNDLIHSINRLVSVIVPLRPKVIVLMHSINDLYNLTSNQSYWGIGTSKKVNNFKFDREDNSILNFISLTKLRRSFNSNSEIPKKINEPIDVIMDTTLLYYNYRNALATFVNVCHDWHITPILETQPHHDEMAERFLNNNSLQFSKEELIMIHDRMNIILKQVAFKYRVKIIDVDQYVSNQPHLFYDYILINKKGSQKIAKITSDSIANWISDSSFLQLN